MCTKRDIYNGARGQRRSARLERRFGLFHKSGLWRFLHTRYEIAIYLIKNLIIAKKSLNEFILLIKSNILFNYCIIRTFEYKNIVSKSNRKESAP